MSHGAHSPRVGVHVATNRSGELARVDGITKTGRPKIFTQLAQRQSGPNDYHMIVGVHTQNLVHSLEADDNPARYWCRAAREPGTGTPCRHRQAVSTRDLRDCRYLFSTARSHDGEGFNVSAVELFVVKVVGIVVWIERHRVGADDGQQFVTWVCRIHVNSTLPLRIMPRRASSMARLRVRLTTAALEAVSIANAGSRTVCCSIRS